MVSFRNVSSCLQEHGATSQKNWIFSNTAVSTANVGLLAILVIAVCILLFCSYFCVVLACFGYIYYYYYYYYYYSYSLRLGPSGIANPGRDKIFSPSKTHPQLLWVPPNVLLNGYHGPLPGVKAAVASS
jgi:hypothetical protein